MIKRPKASDTEDDIIKMQNEFLAEKAKSDTFEPAAKLVKVEQPKKLSKFAQERVNHLKSSNDSPPVDKLTEKPISTQNIVIGNIVERTENVKSTKSLRNDTIADDKVGFPKPHRIDKKIKIDPTSSKSIFALIQEKKAEKQVASCSSMQIDAEPRFDSQSNIVCSTDADTIHKENVQFLQSHAEEEILEQQKRLLSTLDPSLVNFLKAKRKSKLNQVKENISSDVEMKEATAQKIASLPDIDVLKDVNSKNWQHFDVIETEKLEWMRDLPKNLPELKPGEQYEARFDWKGVLLPFIVKDDAQTATSTELFLHGDDAHRPGYTLQELFRLARSTVIQQRISAIGSVGGILSIYNQGYYDGIFELPISKMFFLLRYAFDDNTPAMLEVSAKALSTMFYVETDEVLLDTTIDCSFDCLEPTLEIRSNEDETSNTDANLENQLAKLSIKSGIQANVNDDENKLSSMNDFHLAETDLIQCFLRTNILQRINYILTLISLENSTKLSCVKILIRLARTSENVMQQILSHAQLMQYLFEQFSQGCQSNDHAAVRLHNTTKAFILKLFRVICSYGETFIDCLRKFGLDSTLKASIFVQENSITVETVKIQIEALRTARIVTTITKSDNLFDECVPALQYTLEWIYQFVNFQDEKHFLFRQCASALIAFLSSKNAIYSSFDRLSTCFSKWFSIASQYGNLELSQIVLLATCLNAIKIPDAYREFLQSHFRKFLESSTYRTICDTLSKSSGILATYSLRKQDHKPFPHLHSIVFNTRNSPVFIVSERPTIYLINSIVRFYNTSKYTDNGLWLNDGIRQYIQRFIKNTEWKFSMNWFMRQEIILVLDLLRSTIIRDGIEKSVQLNLAYKVVHCLAQNQINDILNVFSHFIFNIDMYANQMGLSSDVLNHWKSMYGRICVEHYFNTLNVEQKMIRENFDRIPLLTKDWPCIMLTTMLKMPDQLRALGLQERNVISMSISFMLLQNNNSLTVLSETEQFLYTMIAYLGKDNAFLYEDINKILTEFVATTFKCQKSLNFDSDFNGRFNFENLYISFLDQFQGVSYGDLTFSKLVMAPLAQKHNIKWRQMIWSEHLHVLRFVSCTENELIGELRDYLEPPETDVGLLKCYYQAINSSILLSNSAPYKIAVHHLNAHKAAVAQTKMT